MWSRTLGRRNCFVNHDVLISIFYLYWGTYCAHKIDIIWKLVATKRKIYDDAKNGRYDSAKSASSYTRSHYQPSRDYTSRDYGSRSAGSRYSRDDYTTGSRYSDYTSSKSHGRGSMFRGLFEKTFSRFFGGRLRKQTSSFFIWHLCLCFVWELFELTASFVDARVCRKRIWSETNDLVVFAMWIHSALALITNFGVSRSGRECRELVTNVCFIDDIKWKRQKFEV